MPRRTRLQTAKDVAVIFFCITGLIYMVVAGADRISQILSRPLERPKAVQATGTPAKENASLAKGADDAKDLPTKVS